MDLDHPILAGYSHLAESDLPADPERQHMGSGDHLNSSSSQTIFRRSLLSPELLRPCTIIPSAGTASPRQKEIPDDPR